MRYISKKNYVYMYVCVYVFGLLCFGGDYVLQKSCNSGRVDHWCRTSALWGCMGRSAQGAYPMNVNVFMKAYGVVSAGEYLQNN